MFFRYANVWATIMLGQLQNRSGFDNDLRKRCPFSSQIESSFSNFQKQGHALMTNNQSFKFTVKLMNLVTTENWEHRSSHLSQVTYTPGLTKICRNLISKDFFGAVKIFFSFFLFNL